MVNVLKGILVEWYVSLCKINRKIIYHSSLYTLHLDIITINILFCCILNYIICKLNVFSIVMRL